MPENTPSASGCRFDSEGLLLHLYGESSTEDARQIERHLADCGLCRAELDSLRETLDTIESADLSSLAATLADRDAPGAWDNIASRLGKDSVVFAGSGKQITGSTPYWLRAAAVLLIAGGSFLAGAEWMSAGRRPGLENARPGIAGGSVSKDSGGGTLGARDPGAALREFTAQTDGYLNRSRIILLEIANADTGS